MRHFQDQTGSMNGDEEDGLSVLGLGGIHDFEEIAPGHYVDRSGSMVEQLLQHPPFSGNTRTDVVIVVTDGEPATIVDLQQFEEVAPGHYVDRSGSMADFPGPDVTGIDPSIYEFLKSSQEALKGWKPRSLRDTPPTIIVGENHTEIVENSAKAVLLCQRGDGAKPVE